MKKLPFFSIIDAWKLLLSPLYFAVLILNDYYTKLPFCTKQKYQSWLLNKTNFYKIVHTG
jgi:hypothetical protein